jgi:transposase InsO family protein
LAICVEETELLLPHREWLDLYRSINAPVESFFHSLKVELVHQRCWATREEARRDLFGYIEGYYNRQRIHSALGYLTPEQAERKMN